MTSLSVSRTCSTKRDKWALLSFIFLLQHFLPLCRFRELTQRRKIHNILSQWHPPRDFVSIRRTPSVSKLIFLFSLPSPFRGVRGAKRDGGRTGSKNFSSVPDIRPVSLQSAARRQIILRARFANCTFHARLTRCLSSPIVQGVT